MHILAYVYHWEERTLFSMKRSRRKKWVEMVLHQKEAERKEIEDFNPPVPTKQ